MFGVESIRSITRSIDYAVYEVGMVGEKPAFTRGMALGYCV